MKDIHTYEEAESHIYDLYQELDTLKTLLGEIYAKSYKAVVTGDIVITDMPDAKERIKELLGHKE